jgi:hypothetical protein
MNTLARVFLVIGLLFTGAANAAEKAETATVYRDPNCGCCGEYVKYLEKNGFRTKVVIMDDMQPVKRQNKIPRAYESCHTVRIGGYVVEGHVPVAAIKKMLAEKPAITGISVPGMPAGSPGMSGEKTEPLAVYEIAPEDKASEKPKLYYAE